MKKQLLRWFGILLCWCLFVSCFSVPARASASGTVSISCGDGETVTIDNHSFDSELHSGGLRCQALYNDKKLVMQDGNNGVAFVEQGGEAGGTAYFVYATKDAGKTWTKCTNYIKLSSTFTNVFAVDNKIILIDFNYNYDEPFRVSEFTVNPDGSYSDVLIDSQKENRAPATITYQGANTFQVAFQDGTQTTYTLSNSTNESCGTDATWTFEDGVLTISGTGAMTDDSDASPAPWNDYKDSIQKVVITSGITQIGANAFAGCSQLRLLVIPTSVTLLLSRTVHNCKRYRQQKKPCWTSRTSKLRNKMVLFRCCWRCKTLLSVSSKKSPLLQSFNSNTQHDKNKKPVCEKPQTGFCVVC